MGSTRTTHASAWKALLSVTFLFSSYLADAADRSDAAPQPAADINASDSTQGVYSLQDSLRFDNLQTVVYDPQTKALTLLGNRRSEQWLVPIPYLDHLATALESENPSFSLPWTEEAQREWQTLQQAAADSNTALWDRIVGNARKKLFDRDGLLTEQGLRILRALPFPTEGFEAGSTNKFEVMAKAFEVSGGDQQALILGAYGRSLRDPKQLNAALRELKMSRALDASETSDYSARLWATFIERFAGAFAVDPKLPVAVFHATRTNGESIVAARRAAIEDIVTAFYPSWVKAFSGCLELSAATDPYVYLPPDLVLSLAEIRISVKPTWRGIRADSLLAEVLLGADIFLKRMVSDPTLLGSDLPAHLTEYEWNKKRQRKPAQATIDNVRFWISPEVVELAESKDGGVLEIRRVKMRVHTNDAASQAYADYLTSIFDELAKEFPILQELVESAKVAAVAEWLKQKDPQFRLPTEGRGAWTPPSEVLGFITISSEVQVRRSDTASETRIQGKWVGHATVEGGVSLALGEATHWDRGDASVVVLGDARKVVVPLSYENTALKEVLRKKTIPPPPLPPGATGQAVLGKRKLEYIQLLQDRLGDSANADEMQTALRRATELAEKIQFNDKLINDMQAGRINSNEAFRRAEQWAKDEREQFIVDLADIASGGLSDWLGEQEILQFRTDMAELAYAKHRTPEQWLMLSARYAPEVKDQLADIEMIRSSFAGSADPLDRNLAVVTKAFDLMNDISDAFELIPESAVTKRMPGYASLAADSVKGAYKITELHYNTAEVETLSEQVGREARFTQVLQDRQEKYFEKLQEQLKLLEQNATKASK